MPSPIYYSCYFPEIFIVSVTKRPTVYLVDDIPIYTGSVILPEILLSEKLYFCFRIHHQSMFGYISLHSAILVPNNSFIMLVNILLFQHSC